MLFVCIVPPLFIVDNFQMTRWRRGFSPHGDNDGGRHFGSKEDGGLVDVNLDVGVNDVYV